MSPQLREALSQLFRIAGNLEQARSLHHLLLGYRIDHTQDQALASHYETIYTQLRQGLTQQNDGLFNHISSQQWAQLTTMCDQLASPELETLIHVASLLEQKLAPVANVFVVRAQMKNREAVTPAQGYFVASPRYYRLSEDRQIKTYNLHYRFYTTDGRRGKSANIYIGSLNGWPNTFMRAVMRGMLGYWQRVAVYYGVSLYTDSSSRGSYQQKDDDTLYQDILDSAMIDERRQIIDPDGNRRPYQLDPDELAQRLENDVLLVESHTVNREDIMNAWNGAIEGLRGYAGIKALKARYVTDIPTQRQYEMRWGSE